MIPNKTNVKSQLGEHTVTVYLLVETNFSLYIYVEPNELARVLEARHPIMRSTFFFLPRIRRISSKISLGPQNPNFGVGGEGSTPKEMRKNMYGFFWYRRRTYPDF